MPTSTSRSLLVFGLGYTGAAIARAAAEAGFAVTATSRTPAGRGPVPGVTVVPFGEADPAIAPATHILATAAPDAGGDPVLARFAPAVAAAPALRWIGYLSTTGVYGDRGGGWVDEATPPAPSGERGRRRLAAEQAWAGFADRIAVDLFRLAGIYGPGRAPFADLRAGRARRIGKPGHAFGRIHRDDIAAAALAAMGQTLPPGLRVLNLADDEPAENADVIVEAARLLGIPAPPLTPFAQAAPAMTAMALSFWAENRKVSSRRTQEALGLRWRHPTYREGLAAILAAEKGADGPA
ncbi:MAG TPA: SDR family NAD(P)-dependent oxidoreductase [Acetobacteraceae bacterium]|nr:SDR family NAD(P)-dependent oxidoreductase [Acetobacteraceae bacterium]